MIVLLTAVPSLNAQKPNEMKGAVAGNGVDAEDTAKRFSQSVDQFKTDYLQSKPELLKADQKYQAFDVVSKPFYRFTDSMATLKLWAMGAYVFKALDSLKDDMNDSKVSIGDFIGRSEAQTEKLLSVLDQRKASLFITPLATSSPEAGWLLQLIPFDEVSPMPLQYKFMDPAVALAISPISDPSSLVVRTNSQFPHMARGIYQYMIYSPNGLNTSPGTAGSKKSYGTLNLVDPEAKTIICGRAAGILICKTD